MISVILYGRNDSYGYNLHKRAAISLNCIAEVLTHKDDEIIFVDCNTPDDIPTFPEAIQDTLTEKAKKLIRIFRVRPGLYEKIKRGSHLNALEPISRNIGLRRSNTSNRWILSTNTDMIFTIRNNNSLSDVAAKLQDGFYELPRFEIPEVLWETFDRKDPKNVLKQIAYYGKRLRINESVISRPDIRYDGPGDFQLILRKQVFEIQGFNEEMVLGWHVDSNICKRLNMLNGKTDSLINEIFAYHCDHTRQATLMHHFSRKENDQVRFIDKVNSPNLPDQENDWGLPDEKIEEIRLSEDYGLNFINMVEPLIKELDTSYTEDYFITESYNHGLLYDTEHVLLFILNHLTTCSPNTKIGYWGSNIELLNKISQFTLRFYPQSQIFYDKTLMQYNERYDRESVQVNCHEKKLEEELNDLDLLIFDAGLNDFEVEFRNNGISFPKGSLKLFTYLNEFYDSFINAAEFEKETKRTIPRKFLMISCQATWFEIVTQQLIGIVHAPFSSRVRAGYLRKDAFETPLICPSFSAFYYYNDASVINALAGWLKKNISGKEFYYSSEKLQSLIDSYKQPEVIQDKILSYTYNILDLSFLLLKAEIFLMNRENEYALILIKLFEIIIQVHPEIEYPKDLYDSCMDLVSKNESYKKRKRLFVESREKIKVILNAPLYDPSGYADESRNMLLGLNSLDVDIKANPINWSKATADLSIDERNKLEELEHKKINSSNAICLYNIFPKYYSRSQDAQYYIGRTMFETESLPEHWIASCNVMDEIWVPSKFNAETFSNAGIKKEKLFVIPEGIDTERFSPDIKALEIKGRKTFNFLSVFDWSLRKGWDILLRAFIEEFGQSEEVSLTLKVWSSYGRSLEEIRKEAESYLKSNGICQKLPSNIIFLNSNLALKDIPSLYKSADAFVLPTHGEGWGRPFMEAMLMELPVIGTRWSGQLEFMNDENSFLIDCTPENVSKEAVIETPAFKGHKWAEPSLSHLKELMKYVCMNKDEAKKKGKKARTHIIENFDRKIVSQKMYNRLKEISERNSYADFADTKSETVTDQPAGINSQSIASVNWNGPQFTCSSLALINREYVSRLIDTGHMVTATSVNELNTAQINNGASVKKIKEHLSSSSGNADINIYHQWPPDLKAPKQGKWVIMQPWEFGSLPKEWADVFGTKADELWVPGNFVRDIFIESGVPAGKVKVIPNGFDPEVFNPKAKPYQLKTKKKFKFLFVGGTIYRKGIDILMETYLAAFKKSDNVCLVIKDMGSSTFYKGMNFKEKIAELKKTKNAPEIEYIDTLLNEKEMAGLYTACDVLVHPYRGEGFGLPVLEAMACALPVIVTKGGSTDDFCNSENSIQIEAEKVFLKEKKIDSYITVNNPWLLEPSAAMLKEKMTYAYKNPADIKKIGKKGSEFVHAGFTWNDSFKVLLRRIEELSSKPVLRSSSAKPDDIGDLVKLSFEAIENGGYDEAVQNLLEAKNLYPDASRSAVELTDILDLLGNVYLLTDDFENAQTYFSEELKENPSSANACLGLGRVFHRTGLFGEAKTMFEWAVHNNPSSTDAKEELSGINSALGFPDNDNSLLAGTNIVEDDSQIDLITAAEKYLSENNTQKAAELLQTVLDKDPLNIAALNDLSITEIMNRNFTKALSYIDKITDMQPENQQALENLKYIEEILNSQK